MITRFIPIPVEPAVAAEMPTKAGSRWSVSTESVGVTVMMSSSVLMSGFSSTQFEGHGRGCKPAAAVSGPVPTTAPGVDG
jgi:hypothetical protein